MTDICKCFNKECPSNNTCYRYLAETGYYQSYCDFKPDDSGKCGNYWKVESKEEVDKLNKEWED